MKNGFPGTNGSDLNKDNIIKPTLDHLSKEDRKTLEAYHKEVDVIFLLGAHPRGCGAYQHPQV
jgi:hypothetical protein